MTRRFEAVRFAEPNALLSRLDALGKQGQTVEVIVVYLPTLGDAQHDALLAIHERAPLVPKIVLVAQRNEQRLERAVQEAGVTQFLFPPFDALQLELCLDGIFYTRDLAHDYETLLAATRSVKQNLRAEVLRNEQARQREFLLRRQNRSLGHRASVDGLTGLYNHAYLIRALHQEVERALRTGVPLGVLMIDVDNFREYNNRLGHQTGDAVLCRVAHILKAQRRVNDIVARYGGEEFAVLLVNADRSVAALIAERLRARVATEPFARGRLGRNRGLTISIGVASCPIDGTETDIILRAADTALLNAKAAGRNRVIVANETTPPSGSPQNQPTSSEEDPVSHLG